MDIFFAERLTKWRIRSISPTSGSGGGESARAFAPSKVSTGGDGTSQAGSRCVRRPAWLRSNNNSVDCVRCIFRRFSISSFALGAKPQASRSFSLGNGSGVSARKLVDFRLRPLFRNGKADGVLQLRIPAAEMQSGVEPGFQQTRKHGSRIAGKSNRELLEEWPLEAKLKSGLLAQLIRGIMSLAE